MNGLKRIVFKFSIIKYRLILMRNVLLLTHFADIA